MSWLSEALKRNNLDVLNKVAKPIQAVANPIVNNIPVVGAVKQGIEAVGDYIPGGPKSVGGLPGITPASSGGPDLAALLGQFLTGNKGLNALGTAQGINAALLGQKAIQYAKDAEGTAMSAWNKNAPLRDAGRAGMLAPKPSVDTSFLPGIRRSGNPFAK